MVDRAAFFVDGNNWFHSLRAAGVRHQKYLDYAKIAQRLAGPRTWTELRYYVGQVPNSGHAQIYADQRSFMAAQQRLDGRISFHLGRLERRSSQNEAATELKTYLANLRTRIDQGVYQDLIALARRHEQTTFFVEKAVDVMLAVDLVVMAERGEYDTAYVLSADGDYTHAVSFVRGLKKKVFAVSASHGAQLAAAVDSFIHVDSAWFTGLYQPLA